VRQLVLSLLLWPVLGVGIRYGVGAGTGAKTCLRDRGMPALAGLGMRPFWLCRRRCCAMPIPEPRRGGVKCTGIVPLTPAVVRPDFWPDRTRLSSAYNLTHV